MKDSELIRAFLPILNDQLPLYGFDGVIVKQANQPTQQGIPTPPTVFFYKIADYRRGFLGRRSQWDILTAKMEHTEEQQYETTFQLSSLVTINPANPNQYTACDLVNTCAAIMQSDSTRAALAQQNIGILRIINITNPYFVDDRDNFEASPSFDFVLTHRQTRVTTDPVVNSVTLDINRV